MANSSRYANGKHCTGIPATSQYVAVAACNPFSSSENPIPDIEEISKKLQRHLNIKVVDDTALIDTSFISKKPRINKNRRQETHEKKKKRPTKRKARKDYWKIKKTTATDSKGKAAAVAYSRAEMVALSFQNVEDQRKKWSEVYGGLAASVAAEYDGLAAAAGAPSFEFYHQPFVVKPDHFAAAAAMGKRSPLKISVH